ncbi:Fe-Mn family superoxide dismutase, partial [Streptomyces sp. NPDC059909]|uniref:Fe-Mn family superoxide dismutase n=1 Tax=Streptomyces sp. NPDC059909 TaxID=3346998 RepID=UPI003668BBDF
HHPHGRTTEQQPQERSSRARRHPRRELRSRVTQLSKAAATTQGSGWGVLAYEPVSGRLIVEQVYDHQGNVGQGSVPILVFDAWEHAFYLQYKNQKVDFIEAMWQVVNWQDVAKHYAEAKERTPLIAP